MRNIFFYLVFILSAQSLVAQIPGKIMGIVSDKNGEPLVGCNVVIDGEMKGAGTDEDGFFMIVNVLPGTYSLTASFLGYQTVTIKKVIVKPDLTTKVNFVLNEQVLQMDNAIVVIAERPVIQRDATAKVTTVTADEIQLMPINNLQEILSTQSNISVLSNTPNAKAGYNIRGIDDIRMRGGRNNEVALMIDGVKVSNPIFGGFGTQIGKNAIEQISIESGGFSAKYGNALSGVINLTTREGRDKTVGSFRYYTSRPFGMSALTTKRSDVQNKQNLQFTLGGKLTYQKKISYFLSAETNTQVGTVLKFDDITWDKYNTIEVDENNDGIVDGMLQLPSSREIIEGYLQYGDLNMIQEGLANNWSKVVGPDGRKINPLDRFSGWQGFGWNNYYNVFAKLGYNVTSTLRIRLSALTEQRYRQYNNFNAWYIYDMQGQNVQILNSNKITLSINHAFSKNMFYDLKISRFFEQRKIRILKDYNNRFVSWYNPFAPDEQNLKSPEEYIPYLSSEAVYDPFENAFYLKADNRWYSGDKSNNYEIRFDFTNEFHKNYKLETGLQYNYIDLNYHSYQNISEIDPYPTIYHRTPKEGAVYAQLKSDLDKLIINAGIRLDYSDSGGEFWENPFDPLATQDGDEEIEYNKLVKVKPHYNISPRLGLAYPLTSSTVLFFNFGHFYQNPNYRDLYRASGDNREISIIRGNIIGNPNLKPEKSVQYEISLQQQIGKNIGLKINLWSKETTDQVGSVVVPAYSDDGADNPYTYAVFVNNNFGSARGVDVEVKKNISRNIGFNVSYTYSHSKVLQPTSWDGYWAGETQEDQARQEITSPWDQTHVVRATFQYVLSKNQGIILLNRRPLQNTSWNIVYYGESGMPYTPYIPGGVIAEPYSERWAPTHRVDFRVAKRWRIAGTGLNVFMEIKNLFDRKNVLSGYTYTGSATDPGTSSYYTLSSSYWDSRNNNNFALRRAFYTGFEVNFGE